MTSAAMTPIPNKNLVRLFTTVSPTHLTTLLVSRLLLQKPMLVGPSNLYVSVRSLKPTLHFSLRHLPFPCASIADKGWGETLPRQARNPPRSWPSACDHGYEHLDRMKVDETAVYGSMDLFLGVKDLFFVDP